MARRVKFGADGPEFTVHHEGYLEKLRRFGHNRRYFLLFEASIVYFHFVPPKFQLIPRPEGDIPLTTVLEVGLAEEDARVIKIQVPNRTFWLKAKSQDDASTWLAKIRAAVDSTSAKRETPSFTTGELLPDYVVQSARTGETTPGTRRDAQAESWWKTRGTAPHQDEQKTECVLCQKHFTALRWKFWCSICGKPHCDRCSSHAIMKKRVCSVCFVAAVNAEAEAEVESETILKKDSQAELEKRGPLGKYAKMEGVGVPLHGIFQAMKRDGVPPEDALPFAQRRGEAGMTAYTAIFEREEKPDAPAGAERVSRNSENEGKHFRRKTQPFYWNALAKQDSTDSPTSGRRSVWDRSGEDALAGRHKVTVLQHEQIELESLFKLRTKSNVKSPRQGQQDVKIVSFLDNKRAQNVLVVLKRFKCTLPELLYSIAAAPLRKDAEGRPRSMPASFQITNLSAGQIQLLMTTMPLAEEANALQRFQGDLKVLRPAEQWLKMVSDAERVPEKIHIAFYEKDFETLFNRARSRCQSIATACDEIIGSTRLARVLEVVLAVGNVLNKHTRLGNAEGFDISSLLTLSHTKAVDNETSLLRYIVRLLRARGEHDLLRLEADMTELATAARLEESPCAADVKLMQDGLRRCERELKRFDIAKQELEIKMMRKAEAEMRSFLHAEQEEEARMRAEEVKDEICNLDSGRASPIQTEAHSGGRSSARQSPTPSDDVEEGGRGSIAHDAATFGMARQSEMESRCPEDDDTENRRRPSLATKNPDLSTGAMQANRGLLLASIAQAGNQAAKRRAKQKKKIEEALNDPTRMASSSIFPDAALKLQWGQDVGAFVAKAKQKLEELDEVKNTMQENCVGLADYVCEPYTKESQGRIMRTVLGFLMAVQEANRLEDRRDERLQEQFDEMTGRIGMAKSPWVKES